MNKSILIGRITKDLELKYTSSNIAFCKFTLAVNRAFAKDEVDFIQCTVWRKNAENLTEYQHKGSLIAVEGRIQTGSYDDKEGKRVYTFEVVCDSIEYLSSKKEFSSPEAKEIYNETNGGQGRESIDVSEDDLPF